MKTAVNSWVQNLVAGTALIEKLFAKSITVQSGGSIQSSNYSAGGSGFKIDSYGNAEFGNGKFRGIIAEHVATVNANATYDLAGCKPESGAVFEYTIMEVSGAPVGTVAGVLNVSYYGISTAGTMSYRTYSTGSIYSSSLSVSSGTKLKSSYQMFIYRKRIG